MHKAASAAFFRFLATGNAETEFLVWTSDHWIAYRWGMSLDILRKQADHSAEIERIETILASGARSIAVGGQKTDIDVDSLRRELRRLREEDFLHRGRRPVVAKINLRNV